jgi:glycosyltransferase involved in cell wall biosynthesis
MTRTGLLRVAMIAPPWLRVPPNGYGGVENVIANLVSGLQKLDVEVDLFTVGGSKPSCKVEYCFADEQYQYMHSMFEHASTPAASHLLFALNKIAQDGEYDIIHDHNMWLGPLALRWATESVKMPPALHTNHWSFFTTDDTIAKGQPDYMPGWRELAQAGRVYVNGISDYQMQSAPNELKPRILSPVYNGTDIEKALYEPVKQDYFLTLARFQPEKGIHIAARLCAENDYRLKIAGPISEMMDAGVIINEIKNSQSKYNGSESFEYFKNEVWPIVERSVNIEYLGSIGGREKQSVIAGARALLFPITWDEPFGVAVIEALACGTPVIAMRRGAMSELIRHGENGFLANTEEEFLGYMKRIDEIDPLACRKSAEEQFSSESMARGYLQHYRTIIGK